MPAFSVAQFRSSEFFNNSSEIPQKTYLVSGCQFNEAVKLMGSKDREFFLKALISFELFIKKREEGNPLDLKNGCSVH